MMTFSTKTALALALGMAAAPVLAQTETGPNGLPIVGGAEMSPEKTIVGNAVNSADHTTLVAAVQEAGLTDTLNGTGPFTVFAPVNEAFAALPAGTVETLLLPENRDQLTTILTCHVLGSKDMTGDIRSMITDGNGAAELTTLGGCVLTAALDDNGRLTLTDEQGNMARMTNNDVEQLNGVIHVIDAVVLPAAAAPEPDMAEAAVPAEAGDTDMAEGADSADVAEVDIAEASMAEADMTDDTASTDMTSTDMTSTDMASTDMADTGTAASDNPTVGGAEMLTTRDIIDNAVNSADHTTLVAAVQAAGLVETLKGDGPFTVFAPTNAAFDALPDGTVDTLLLPENKGQLTKILTAHVVAGSLRAADIIANVGSDGFYHMNAVSGDALSAKVVGGNRVFIFDETGNAYEVTTADVIQSNGVIHVVEGVLLPR